MKNIFIIFKKELKRFFGDRRMLLAMFLPGLLMFVLYTFMGKIMTNNLLSTEVKDTTYQVVYTDNYSDDTSNKPKLLSNLDTYLVMEGNGNTANYKMISLSSFDEYVTKLKNKEIDILIKFSDKFDDLVVNTSTGNNISIYYNSETKSSTNLYTVVAAFVQVSYNNYTQNIEGGQAVDPDVGQQNIIMTRVLSFVLPMVTVSLLYATITSFCPESISGEKERGTLASILLTPIKTSEFILGKIMALSVVAIASGLVSFFGLIFSLPNLMGLSSLPIAPLEMVLLLLIILSTLLLFVSFGVLISSLSNSIKEAGSYLGPFSALFMILAIVPSLLNSTSIGFAFVPILNLSVCVNALFNQASNLALLFSITFVVNLAFALLFVFLVTKLFKKEEVILGH